jgi:hypothetical protein
MLYFFASPRSVSPSAPCRSSNDLSNPPEVTPISNTPGLVPTFWKVCAVPRGTKITDPAGALAMRSPSLTLNFKLSLHDVEEFVLCLVDVHGRPAPGSTFRPCQGVWRRRIVLSVGRSGKENTHRPKRSPTELAQNGEQ